MPVSQTETTRRNKRKEKAAFLPPFRFPLLKSNYYEVTSSERGVRVLVSFIIQVSVVASESTFPSAPAVKPAVPTPTAVVPVHAAMETPTLLRT